MMAGASDITKIKNTRCWSLSYHRGFLGPAAGAWWLQNIMSRYITPVRSWSWWLKNQKHISCKSEFKRLDTYSRPGWCLLGWTGGAWQAAAPAPTWWPHRWVTWYMSPSVWSQPLRCMTLSTNSLCHEFFIPSQPSSQARRLVQPRTSLCLRWLQTGKCLQLSHL